MEHESVSLLSKIKKGAYLINCARGGLVDEEAVAEALAACKQGLAKIEKQEGYDKDTKFKTAIGKMPATRMRRMLNKVAMYSSFSQLWRIPSRSQIKSAEVLDQPVPHVVAPQAHLDAGL